MDRGTGKDKKPIVDEINKLLSVVEFWLSPGEIDFYDLHSYWKKVCQECKSSWGDKDKPWHRDGCRGVSVLNRIKELINELVNDKTSL